MSDVFDTILLIALPASGKSEIRKYFEHQTENTCRDLFHMGQTVQLDDYPYVHIMRRVDDLLEGASKPRIFFEARDRGFADTVDWGTLISLINEDYADISALRQRRPDEPVRWILDRFDRAREAVGGRGPFSTMENSDIEILLNGLVPEVDELISEWNSNVPASLEGKTIVIEFARGGPKDSPMPLPRCYGYGYSLSVLSREILSKSAILYIWVTPEQSRAKNRERAEPGADGSILFHGVPQYVMLNDYGCDDLEYLLSRCGVADSVKIEAHGETFIIPTGRVDNRQDLTTFVRRDSDKWESSDVKLLGDSISTALDSIWGPYESTRP
jgi:hypothetical protein